MKYLYGDYSDKYCTTYCMLDLDTFVVEKTTDSRDVAKIADEFCNIKSITPVDKYRVDIRLDLDGKYEQKCIERGIEVMKSLEDYIAFIKFGKELLVWCDNTYYITRYYNEKYIPVFVSYERICSGLGLDLEFANIRGRKNTRYVHCFQYIGEQITKNAFKRRILLGENLDLNNPYTSRHYADRSTIDANFLKSLDKYRIN